jgi:hypothetical protein
MLERELDSEADAMQMKVGADGKCVLVKATAKVEINDMMQYSQAAQKFIQYAAQTGAVKFLCTPLQFSQHSSYVVRLIDLSRQFKLKHVLEWDTLFRKRFHDSDQVTTFGPNTIDSWLSPATDLFNDVMLVPANTRINTRPRQSGYGKEHGAAGGKTASGGRAAGRHGRTCRARLPGAPHVRGNPQKLQLRRRAPAHRAAAGL